MLNVQTLLTHSFAHAKRALMVTESITVMLSALRMNVPLVTMIVILLAVLALIPISAILAHAKLASGT